MLPYSKTWGGCQRMYFLAKELQNQGNQVKIIAFQRDKYNTYGKELLKDVVYTEGNDISEPTNEIATNNSKVSKCPLWIKKIIYKLDYCFFNEIQEGKGIRSYLKYCKGKKNLISNLKNNTFDTVVVSCPPFNLFRSVPVIRKYSPSSKVIMDYRDPWNSWHDKNWFTTLREKKFQKKADVIVCTNEALCKDMSGKFHIKPEKYRVFSNGFIKVDSELQSIPTPEIQEGVMNIVYTGAIGFTERTNDYRNPAILLEAIDGIFKLGYPIRFVFVGVSDPNSVEIEAIKEKYGDEIKFVGVVSNSKALAYVENADACLLLHTSDDNSGKFLISGKAYDYIQKRKYILSIANEDSLHATIVKKYNIGTNSTNDVNSIKDMIIESYNLWKKGLLKNVYSNINVEDFSRDIQIKRYIELINSI